MNWLNLEIRTLRSPEYIGSNPVERATWLNVLAYCCEQENGGVIRGGASWKDRQWQQVCGVTAREVRSATKLLVVEGEDVRVLGYPLDSEAKVRTKREAGREGGLRSGEARARTKQEGSTASSTASPVLPSCASTEGERKEKGKEGEREKEKEKMRVRADVQGGEADSGGERARSESESDGRSQHPTSGGEHPTSKSGPDERIQNPTSGGEHPTSNIQHPTSNGSPADIPSVRSGPGRTGDTSLPGAMQAAQAYPSATWERGEIAGDRDRQLAGSLAASAAEAGHSLGSSGELEDAEEASGAECGEGKGKGAREEVIGFCASIGLSRDDGEWFFDKCEGCGWKNAGTPILDWKATVRAWKRIHVFPSQKLHGKSHTTRNGAGRNIGHNAGADYSQRPQRPQTSANWST